MKQKEGTGFIYPSLNFRSLNFIPALITGTYFTLASMTSQIHASSLTPSKRLIS